MMYTQFLTICSTSLVTPFQKKHYVIQWTVRLMPMCPEVGSTWQTLAQNDASVPTKPGDQQVSLLKSSSGGWSVSCGNEERQSDALTRLGLLSWSTTAGAPHHSPGRSNNLRSRPDYAGAKHVVLQYFALLSLQLNIRLIYAVCVHHNKHRDVPSLDWGLPQL